ncbi:MAG: response regulator transcription factor [Bacteroidetes bacterium]|nr:response regulator transcription factor [Bacteroidota bacterium]MBP6315391.1 response regulator transcription factor [Chitinophagaceae bacterium]
MIKAIIIDDETQGRKLLQALIISHCPQIQVLEECADLPNGVKAIRKHKPDLIFLDIEMPQHSGLDILDFFDEKDIHFGIIFTTAYNEYAVKAFKLSAVDYLLKPISGDDLEQAVERFEKRFNGNKSELNNSYTDRADNKIAIPVGQSIKFIDLDTVVYLKAENTYTEIFMQDSSKLLVSRTLKNFEEVLADKPNFFRCHKSYIINRMFVLDYVKSDGGYLILKPKIEIPISSEKVNEFLDNATIVRR